VRDGAAVQEPRATGVVAALIAVYLSWSSTYLAIRFAIEGLPPLLMMGTRFFVFGLVFYYWLRLRGAARPSLREWWWSTVIGVFLMLGGSAGVAYAEQWVASGLAALVIATTPLWTVLFAALWKHRPSRVEWTGLAVGLCGILLLNMGGDLRANPLGAAVLVIAAMSWAFGSAWSQHLPLPRGMMAGAAQMIAGGAVVLIVGFLSGERVTAMPPLRAVAAVVYLGIVGSLIGFTAYIYLLGKVRPALATSYAYVNPVLALLLGLWFGDERVGLPEVAAMSIILAGVVLVVLGQKGKVRTREEGNRRGREGAHG
jgi:drug/metabolite transporter (DMT)-like permease